MTIRRVCLLGFVLMCCGMLGCASPGGEGEGGKDSGVPSERRSEPAGKVCVSARDCPGEDCRQGKCVSAVSCTKHAHCREGERCYKERCITICCLDTDCAAEHVCVDGLCHRFVPPSGKAPNEGKSQRQALRVGLAVAPLDHPLGVSMAGYGFRPGPKGPYAKALGASTGMYERFVVKALVLDDGVERLVLVRSPLVFSTDLLISHLVRRISKETGIDWTGRLIVVSTHSHSAPARFWNLLTAYSFGTFGGGTFHPEVFQRMVASFATAVIEANKNLRPGKIGYVVKRSFDPKNKIFSDRRGEYGNYKHPVLVVLRVEEADGTPLAALVNFPMHGTISSNEWMTNDVGGAVEFALQRRLEEAQQKRIEVFFLQGAAGDVSPRGGHLGHGGIQRIQMVGQLAALEIEKVYQGIQTAADVKLEVVDRRVPLSRKDIGYKDDEFFEELHGEKVPYRYGGFQCVQKGYDYKKEPNKRHKDGKLGCLISVEKILGAPAPQFSKTRLTAARIGELVLVTLPGEPSSWLARDLTEALQQKSKGKIKDVAVLGYAQDHQLYLLRAEDWWRGGYEPSMSVWGPRIGEYLVGQATSLALQLLTPEKEENKTGLLPFDFYQLDLSKRVPREKTPAAGKVVQQPPATYRRMESPFAFVFSGGFPGVDHPKVVVQRKKEGVFHDVKGPGGRLYDDSDHRMRMTFALKGGQYHYTYWFEELEDFPRGTYRFRVEGHRWDGQARQPYTLESRPFELLPSERLRFGGLTFNGKVLRGFVRYPAGTNDDGQAPFSQLKTSGHRLRSHLVPWQVGPPLPPKATVQLKITLAQGNKTLETLTAQKLNRYETAPVRLVTSRTKEGKESHRTLQALSSGFRLSTTSKYPKGTYQLTLSLTDAHGNKGHLGPTNITVQ